PDFFGNAMQPQRRAIRAGLLPDAKARSGTAHVVTLPPRTGGIFKKQNGLGGDINDENEWGGRDTVFFAGVQKNFEFGMRSHHFHEQSF
ncbi:MAG TPA: hypothetical protein VKJ65_08975, partial [Phycisphaerae bacterium]|nr:hypothetical protein [Phycisphaerae bacterium]